MKVEGLLMIEHRLIERMVVLIKKELDSIKHTSSVNEDFIITAIDFFKTYADKCHHGKEEDILFNELQQKKISSNHRVIIDQLIEEHKLGRKLVEELNKNNQQYIKGDLQAIHPIKKILEQLVELYPKHIETEDKHLFLEVIDYFSDEENDNLLDNAYEFDRKMIHEKYKSTIESFEKKMVNE
jgi:hemerythrin-like domain-containing protein